MQTQPRVRRWQASAYLKNTWGIVRAPQTLSKYASAGIGPKYELDGRIPLYSISELDAWAQSLLSPARSTTREQGSF